jgi:D-xylose transport system permease protein
MAKLEQPDAPETVAEQKSASGRDLAVSPDLVATSVPEYLRMSLARIRSGETGILPVVGGLLLVSVLFQWANSNFLTAGNLVNLLVQAAFFSVLAMGEVHVLLLGEIDLSAGFVAGLGGVVMGELVKASTGWPWWAAIAAGLLVWQGVMLKILGEGGSILINDSVINGITSSNLSPIAGWIVLVAVLGISGVVTWRRDARRRAAGLVAPPPTLTGLKIAAGFAGGAAIVALCNINRGRLLPITGVPYVVVLVFLVLALWTFVLTRTRYGRYVYAIGGSAEGARRAGVNLARIRTSAFVLCSLTAGIAGIIYVSRLRSISTSVDGGTLVLYAVAAAVIGGTSLFGGRGKPLHGVLGGVVIAAIDNGMGLLGFAAYTKFMVTAVVLLVAVTIDALARRSRAVR